MRVGGLWWHVQGVGLAFLLWLFRYPGYCHRWWTWLWYEGYYGSEGRGNIGPDTERESQ